ncbi:MAG: metalloregulator ArsR/SmtB family transcription factor [Ardenticatenaceae bacterium]|nr:metalloregulator ArsR/SmtB family transcription factor [Anaerolineales bacterium]MCB8938926.1 metalloregulator ArsR/SmtB family transcription factor [Ardenticatenaceae bacterium]MCB8974682.1 metalloregulator ArsR/SmtB family transcription factor [Ardenticatenaceae bacterium]
MSKTTAEFNLEERAQLFKALGHPARLLMLNLIQQKPRHGEELAAILNLKPATVSHHLSKLAEAGLLTSTKDQYYQMYSLVGDVLKKPLGEVIRLPQPSLTDEVETDAYKQKVLKTFVRQGRVVRLPAQLKKLQVILELIVQEFEPEREYTEKEVNFILLDFHEDVATLRRSLVEHDLMTRSGGIYRRLSN